MDRRATDLTGTLPAPGPEAGRPAARPERTRIVGILNLTPDSFWDGGRYDRVDDALRRAEEMAEQGADWIDVGGVSSRPGAPDVPLEEERRRVMPVLKALAPRGLRLSLDTSRWEIAREGLDLGAGMVNDIRALRDERLAELAARTGAYVVLMHMRGEPSGMQDDPRYADVVGEISDFLRRRAARAESLGVRRERIVLDPGIGFGKTVRHNLEILNRIRDFCGLGYEVMAGPSRKSVIGRVLDAPVQDRLHGTSAAVALCVAGGARWVRVHDVREMAQVVRMTEAVVGGV